MSSSVSTTCYWTLEAEDTSRLATVTNGVLTVQLPDPNSGSLSPQMECLFKIVKRDSGEVLFDALWEENCTIEQVYLNTDNMLIISSSVIDDEPFVINLTESPWHVEEIRQGLPIGVDVEIPQIVQ